MISLCGCFTLRVGDHKMKPDKRKVDDDFKKQFQTSNYSANEYMKWRRSGGMRSGIVSDRNIETTQMMIVFINCMTKHEHISLHFI